MKEVTYEDWQKNPTPRMMWVWDYYIEHKVVRKVVYVSSREYFPVITVDTIGNIYTFCHCAEIEKQRRMTNQELSRWLCENPTREYKFRNDNFIFSNYTYTVNSKDAEVCEDVIIREYYGEWREPLVEVIE